MWQVGDSLDDIRITKILRGGMGLVYVLENGNVAKCLRDEFVNDELLVKAFKNEAHFLVSCDEHPNIVECHGVKTIRDRTFLITDYISKGNLRQNLPSDGLPPFQAAIWAVHVCFAIV